MRAFFVSVALMSAICGYAQPSGKNPKLFDTLVKNVTVRYDPNILRIQGNYLPIGITTTLKNGKVAHTKGFLGGDLKWRNFRIEVVGGSYSFGKIKIDGDQTYKKSQNIEVKVYSRRSKNLLRIQKIPYNYETGIKIITDNKFAKAPGNSVDFGIRTFFDNEMFIDYWPKSAKTLVNNYIISAEGGKISKNGSFVIESDPFKINNHTVKFITNLSKSTVITDTLSIVLDYIDDYDAYFSGSSGSDGFDGSSGSSGGSECNGGDGNDGNDGSDGYGGHNLVVYADVYFDTIIDQELMFVQLTDMDNKCDYNYLINTNGGTIKIVSKGGSGGDGGDGGSGGSGGRGRDGDWRTYTVKINDSTTVEVREQGPGSNGGNGGQGGHGGNGGYGGTGGDIYIHYTPYAEPYLHMIKAYSLPGSGGNSGWGGSGGSAGMGGSGNPSGNSGSSGNGGSSGSMGFGGYSGNVYFEPDSKEQITLSSE